LDKYYLYYIEKEGLKDGPYNLNEILQLGISKDSMIWRSDQENWKKANEYDELLNFISVTKENIEMKKDKKELIKSYNNKFITNFLIYYFVTSILIGFFSFSIAKNSWENYSKTLKPTSNFYNSNSKSGLRPFSELTSTRYKYFVPGGYDNEDAYARGQTFLFKPFKAFGSTIYLTKAERNDHGILFKNLLLSSFTSLGLIFFPLGLLYYLIEVENIKKQN
jgi:hypothetical protein